MAMIESQLERHEERGYPTLALWVASLLLAAILASAWSAAGTLAEEPDVPRPAAQTSVPETALEP
jgi:hypothetical protein